MAWRSPIGPLSLAALALSPHAASAPLDEWPRADFAGLYEAVPVEVQPAAPQYDLPLDRRSLANWDDFRRLVPDVRARRLFAANGFVTIGPRRADDVAAMYEDLHDSGYPILITSDSMLHLYHVQFDDLLQWLEVRYLMPDLEALTEGLLEDALAGHERSAGLLKEAHAHNVCYFGVAASLLGSQRTLPDWAQEAVESELQRIEAHMGFEESSVFGYREDYSAYVPRGHYTRSEALERYFQAMMWYGRMAFVASAEIVSPEIARRQTIQAALIAEALPRLRVADRAASEVWARVSDVTAFFVGVADDLTPSEYAAALATALGDDASAEALLDEGAYDAFRSELAQMRPPAIYGGTGEIVIGPGPDGKFTPEQLDEALAATKGMQFMGHRFVPDSYAMGRLVAPTIGPYTGDGQPFTVAVTQAGPQRAFPRGLDVMTLLGFDNAAAILEELGDTDYERYDEVVAELEQQLAALQPADWHQNLYWCWLEALRALAARPGEGYPSFMQTEAWRAKQLNAALGSWAQLRHDTIVEAKISETLALLGEPPPPPPVFVEPVPELYARLLALTRMTKAGLIEAGLISEGQTGSLGWFGSLLSGLLDISVKELQGEELTEDEVDFIRSFVAGPELRVVGTEEEAIWTTVIADVHADPNTGQVLEEGTGRLMLLVAAMPTPDGRVFAAAGPSFSYYEFKQPMSDRLTDQTWRQMLESDPPDLPEWTESFRARR